MDISYDAKSAPNASLVMIGFILLIPVILWGAWEIASFTSAKFYSTLYNAFFDSGVSDLNASYLAGFASLVLALAFTATYIHLILRLATILKCKGTPTQCRVSIIQKHNLIKLKYLKNSALKHIVSRPILVVGQLGSGSEQIVNDIARECHFNVLTIKKLSEYKLSGTELLKANQSDIHVIVMAQSFAELENKGLSTKKFKIIHI